VLLIPRDAQADFDHEAAIERSHLRLPPSSVNPAR
jgi:hypothetical protein